uniref:Cytochrome f n=1 Tax=Trichogloeopsis pedicellata TaxID=1495610 RepID=A0A1G4P0J7_9FLOR|nr:Apocytochrome f [Trichogloeopsis pedicellata]SCW24422.1 Apocytochrome f [Trichogloeopsis pedicellata]
MVLNYPAVRKRKHNIIIYFILSFITLLFIRLTYVNAFPIYAQQAYENPREATGRIVCANCHLAQKPTDIEVPKSVLPNTVFEAVVKIPYDSQAQQILGNGKKGPMNVGAVVILPQGFKLAPANRMSEELKNKTKGVYIQTYSTKQDNILVVGPVPGDKNKEIIFPILSPDPSINKNTAFLKYPVFVGANRGRGQVYPTGDKTNNTIITSSISGKIIEITNREKGGYEVRIAKGNDSDSIVTEIITRGLELKVKEGDNIITGQALTKDPNVGGFGQNETEIVLQSPARIQGMIAFFVLVTISQIFFVLKKKQWEKVQAAEINF